MIRVLIVDDDPDFLMQQKLQLEHAGFEVLEADNRQKAKQIVDSNTFDVAVLDLMMEDLDAGFVLARDIKRKNPAIPVIMVTGVASETGMEFDAATQEERSWIKADALLAKPVRFEQLLREINRLLKR
ncbi:MAG TPA: response regulator [Candidatus Hydrogenedentes bacterium]|nr:response regulator [Candidatus Hydrogenedentota bacterium]HOL78115.1 response regulator [Candidatus Hydrogenedentota bacterium]HPO85597.1 response regulator [Candidatus Hydrogenedentota bacterium]